MPSPTLLHQHPTFATTASYNICQVDNNKMSFSSTKTVTISVLSKSVIPVGIRHITIVWRRRCSNLRLTATDAKEARKRTKWRSDNFFEAIDVEEGEDSLKKVCPSYLNEEKWLDRVDRARFSDIPPFLILGCWRRAGATWDMFSCLNKNMFFHDCLLPNFSVFVRLSCPVQP